MTSYILINGDNGFLIETKFEQFTRVLVYRGKSFLKTITLSDGRIELTQANLDSIKARVGQAVTVTKDKY